MYGKLYPLELFTRLLSILGWRVNAKSNILHRKCLVGMSLLRTVRVKNGVNHAISIVDCSDWRLVYLWCGAMNVEIWKYGMPLIPTDGGEQQASRLHSVALFPSNNFYLTSIVSLNYFEPWFICLVITNSVVR